MGVNSLLVRHEQRFRFVAICKEDPIFFEGLYPGPAHTHIDVLIGLIFACFNYYHYICRLIKTLAAK